MEEGLGREPSQETEHSVETTSQDSLISALEQFGLKSEQISNISIIGFRENSAYLVESGDNKYVAKLLANENGRREGDILRDGYASSLVGQMGLDSRRLLSIPGSQGEKVAVFSYVEGRSGFLAKNELLENESLDKVATYLNKVHKTSVSDYYNEDIKKPPRTDSRTDFQSFTLGYLLNDLRAIGLPDEESRFRVAVEAASNVERGKFALIHGDVNAHNIVWKEGGDPTVIDWSYSQYGDPSKDLAGALFYLHEQGGENYSQKLLSLVEMYSQDFPQVKHNIDFFLGSRYIISGKSQVLRGIQSGSKHVTRGLELLSNFSQNA